MPEEAAGQAGDAREFVGEPEVEMGERQCREQDDGKGAPAPHEAHASGTRSVASARAASTLPIGLR